MASLRGDKKEIAAEAADVLYHLLVLCRPAGSPSRTSPRSCATAKASAAHESD